MFRYLMMALFLLCAGRAAANGIQYFNSGTYLNPANMDKTACRHLVAGILVPNIYDKFHGSVLSSSGTVKSVNTLTLPYIQFATRLSDRIVAGVDYSNPVLAYVLWPVTGFQRNLAIDAVIQSFEITPKISFSITEKFSLGFSLRYVNIWRAELNYAVIRSFVLNRAKGDGFGGTFGFRYNFTPRTSMDFSAFTPIKTTVNGESISGAFVNSKFKTSPFTLIPATFILNCTHIFNQKFLAAFKFAYTYWLPDKKLQLNNTAIGLNPVIFPLKWKNTIFAMVSGQYRPIERFALLGSVGFDQTPAKASTNILAFPIENLPFGGIGGQYYFTQSAWIKVFAAMAAGSNPKIKTSPHLVDGSIYFRFSWLDVSSTVDF